MVALVRFLSKYNEVYGRKGNILLNRIANFQLLLSGKAALEVGTKSEGERARAIETIDATWKMMLTA